jgi:cytoskeletal protein CcmA (bactofilin family)
MRARILVALLLLLVPAVSFASTITSARTLVLSESMEGNVYLAGTDITVTAPQQGDVLALGATMNLTAPVTGDVMVAGGTIELHKAVAGDVRAVGGKVHIDGPIGGDLVAAGGEVTASTSAKDTHIAGGTVTLSGGSTGDVTVYASDVSLAGDYMGDVTVSVSDKLVLLPGTHIHGKLNYNAPEQVTLPDGVLVDGGVVYTGSSSYLPTNQQAQTFAIAGASILFLVQLLAVIILTGLLAGLFPVFTERVADRTLEPSTLRFVLLTLLGFGLFVATPVLILFLILSFVGIGVALFLIPLYALFFMLSYAYAGIITGTVLARAVLKRSIITWKEAVVGMLVLYLVGIVPVVGMLIKCILIMVAGGAIASIVFSFAFKRKQPELPLA